MVIPIAVLHDNEGIPHTLRMFSYYFKAGMDVMEEYVRQTESYQSHREDLVGCYNYPVDILDLDNAKVVDVPFLRQSNTFPTNMFDKILSSITHVCDDGSVISDSVMFIGKVEDTKAALVDYLGRVKIYAMKELIRLIKSGHLNIGNWLDRMPTPCCNIVSPEIAAKSVLQERREHAAEASLYGAKYEFKKSFYPVYTPVEAETVVIPSWALAIKIDMLVNVSSLNLNKAKFVELSCVSDSNLKYLVSPEEVVDFRVRVVGALRSIKLPKRMCCLSNAYFGVFDFRCPTVLPSSIEVIDHSGYVESSKISMNLGTNSVKKLVTTVGYGRTEVCMKADCLKSVSIVRSKGVHGFEGLQFGCVDLELHAPIALRSIRVDRMLQTFNLHLIDKDWVDGERWGNQVIELTGEGKIGHLGLFFGVASGKLDIRPRVLVIDTRVVPALEVVQAKIQGYHMRAQVNNSCMCLEDEKMCEEAWFRGGLGLLIIFRSWNM